MEEYKGKCKCSCGKPGKHRVTGIGGYLYACHEHKDRIAKHDKGQPQESGEYSEADYQTWMRV